MIKKKILIVEDELIVAEDVKRTIIKFGYEISGIVPSAQAAFKQLEEQIPDLILMDINLKGDMNGVEAADIIKKDYDIPLVYLTANADVKTMKNAKITEHFGYILKPFEERELQTIMGMAFYRFKIEKKLKDSKRKILFLHDVAHKLASCKNEKDVYTITIQAAEDILDFCICTLDIIEGNKLVVKAKTDASLVKDSTEFDICENLMKETVEIRKTIIIDDIEKEKNISVSDVKLKSLMSSPIGDLGVFQVASANCEAFNEEDGQVIDLLLGHTYEALKRISLQDKLKKLAVHDSLTGVYNRHFLKQALEREIKQARRYNRTIAFLMIDINGLKKINDKYGHQVGDVVIKSVSDFLVAEARETDVIVRYGGDEFLIMLPETGKDADVIRDRLIDKMSIWNETNETIQFTVSFSVGCAYWSSEEPKTIKEIISEADTNMYKHKELQKAKMKLL
ncbi:MAG: diguanylate cyclase [Candidatus Cloacimonetes bacterium]|nr:diguanylate cyclase [Candidatus Cloacimonadota bacterium]